MSEPNPNQNPGSYDPEFDKEIRGLAPQWWEDTTAANKARLPEMARNGEPRPNSRIPLGHALASYTCKTSSHYDPDFDREIRQLAPQWFHDTTAANKAKLLEMARNDEPRPGRRV